MSQLLATSDSTFLYYLSCTNYIKVKGDVEHLLYTCTHVKEQSAPLLVSVWFGLTGWSSCLVFTIVHYCTLVQFSLKLLVVEAVFLEIKG